jgi:hypothetical protein
MLMKISPYQGYAQFLKLAKIATYRQDRQGLQEWAAHASNGISLAILAVRGDLGELYRCVCLNKDKFSGAQLLSDFTLPS